MANSVRALSVLWFILLCLAGCSSGTNPPPSIPQPLPNGTYNYVLDVSNLRPLDTTSGQYVLWLKMIDDTMWHSKSLNFWRAKTGFLEFAGQIQLPSAPDSIQTVEISVEPMAVPPSPSSLLLTGSFYQDSSTLSSVVGDYSDAGASVIFTTQSSDTNRSKQEFYLMRFVNGLHTATAMNMPAPPNGWTYGLWVLDSNFYPKHRFFYGWFRNADSSSSEWKPGEFQFPGGFNPAPMNDPGARLEVTLEPQFAIQSNRPNAPSPLTILWSQLRRFIDFNDSLTLVNSWHATEPEGKLTITN